MTIEKLSVNGAKQEETGLDELTGSEQGAYETFRVHKNKVFLLNEHFDRLGKSLRALNLGWDDERVKYSSWIANLCQDLPADKDAFVRFVVSSVDDEVKTIIYVGYIDFYSPKNYQAFVINKLRLDLPDYFSETGFRIKSVDYIKDNLAMKKSAGLEEDIDGILLTPEGYVAEGLTSNVFWSKDGQLFSPPLQTGILAGTMRAYLMNINEVQEVLATADDLESAEEIILTSGASYLRPLSKINNIEKPGVNGSMFKKLYDQLQKDLLAKSESL